MLPASLSKLLNCMVGLRVEIIDGSLKYLSTVNYPLVISIGIYQISCCVTKWRESGLVVDRYRKFSHRNEEKCYTVLLVASFQPSASVEFWDSGD